CQQVAEREPGSTRAEGVAPPNVQRHPRAPRIGHDPGLRPGPQHSSDLAESLLGVWSVVENSPGINEIEAIVLEWQSLGVADPDVRIETFIGKPFTDRVGGGLRQVHAVQPGTGAGEPHEVSAKAETDLEHVP